MNKIVTESPSGLKVAIIHYNSGRGAIEIDTEDKMGINWSLWFDNIDDLVFLADTLNEYISERNLRKEGENGK